MPNIKDCILSAQKEFSDILNANEIKNIGMEIKRLKELSKRTGQDFEKLFAEHIANNIEEIKMNHAKRILSMEKFDEIFETLSKQEVFKKDPMAALESLFDTKNFYYEGAGNVHRESGAIADAALSLIANTLYDNQSLWKKLSAPLNPFSKAWITESKKITKQVYEAMFPSKSGPKITDPQILALANALKQVNDYMYDLKVKAGFSTKKVSNYIMKQFHDIKGIYNLDPNYASGKTTIINRDIIKSKWKDVANKTFDFQKMGWDPDEIDTNLDNLITKFLDNEGRSGGLIDDEFADITKPKIARALEASRTIHFKDGASAHAYAEALGGGQNILDDITKSIEGEAKKIAAARTFGPNARAIYKKLKDKFRKQLQDKPKQLAKFIDNEKKLDDLYEFTTRGLERPPDNLMAKAGRALRMVTDMSKLGTGVFSTITDVPYAANILSKETGKNILSSYASITKNFISTLPLVGEGRKKTALNMGVFIQDTLNMSNARYYEQSNGTGWFSRSHKRVMDLTGLPAQAHMMRTANSKAFAVELASAVKSGFDNTELKPSLQRFGITEANWREMHKGIVKLSDGTEMITPESLRNIDQDLSFKIHSYLSDVAEIGSPTPGPKQHIWRARVKAGTPMGELQLFVMQYKSFIRSQVDTMSRVYNAGLTGTDQAAYLKGIGPMVLVMGQATIAGYMALQMKQLAKGRVIMPPVDEEGNIDKLAAIKLFKDSFLQSGAGLIYSDFLLSDYQAPYQGIPQTISGPVLGGTLNRSAKFMGQFADISMNKMFGDGEKSYDKLQKPALNFANDVMPRVTVFSPIIYRVFYDMLNESINPGAAETRRERMEAGGLKDLLR